MRYTESCEPRPQGGWYVTTRGDFLFIEQETIDNAIDEERIEPQNVFEYLKYVHDWNFGIAYRTKFDLGPKHTPRHSGYTLWHRPVKRAA